MWLKFKKVPVTDLIVNFSNANNSNVYKTKSTTQTVKQTQLKVHCLRAPSFSAVYDFTQSVDEF